MTRQLVYTGLQVFEVYLLLVESELLIWFVLDSHLSQGLHLLCFEGGVYAVWYVQLFLDLLNVCLVHVFGSLGELDVLAKDVVVDHV